MQEAQDMQLNYCGETSRKEATQMTMMGGR